jgi:hypothetical protein
MNRRLPIADAATNIYEISAHPGGSGYHVHIVGSDGARQTMLGFETEAARSVLQLAGPGMCGSSLFGNREVSGLAVVGHHGSASLSLALSAPRPDCSVLFADFRATTTGSVLNRVAIAGLDRQAEDRLLHFQIAIMIAPGNVCPCRGQSYVPPFGMLLPDRTRMVRRRRKTFHRKRGSGR